VVVVDRNPISSTERDGQSHSLWLSPVRKRMKVGIASSKLYS
jgi:hypothetical protein